MMGKCLNDRKEVVRIHSRYEKRHQLQGLYAVEIDVQLSHL